MRKISIFIKTFFQEFWRGVPNSFKFYIVTILAIGLFIFVTTLFGAIVVNILGNMFVGELENFTKTDYFFNGLLAIFLACGAFYLSRILFVKLPKLAAQSWRMAKQEIKNYEDDGMTNS